MELIFLFFTGFTIGISGAVIPGPLTLFTVSRTLTGGPFTGLKVITGHVLVELSIVIAITFGLRSIFSSSAFLMYMSIAGAAAFIIMGGLLCYNARYMKLSLTRDVRKSEKGLIAGGFFFSAVSPGFIIWWGTIGIATLLRAFSAGVVGVMVLCIGHWFADAVWYGLLSYVVDRGKRFLSEKRYQNILFICGLLLVALGVYF